MSAIKFNRELTTAVDRLFRMGNPDPGLETIIEEHTGVESFQGMDEIRSRYQHALPNVKDHLRDEWPTVHPVTQAWYAGRDENEPYRERDVHSLNSWQRKASVAGIPPVNNRTYGLRRATIQDDPLFETFMSKFIDQGVGLMDMIEQSISRAIDRGLLTEESLDRLAKGAERDPSSAQVSLFEDRQAQLQAPTKSV